LVGSASFLVVMWGVRKKWGKKEADAE